MHPAPVPGQEAPSTPVTAEGAPCTSPQKKGPENTGVEDEHGHALHDEGPEKSTPVAEQKISSALVPPKGTAPSKLSTPVPTTSTKKTKNSSVDSGKRFMSPTTSSQAKTRRIPNKEGVVPC